MKKIIISGPIGAGKSLFVRTAVRYLLANGMKARVIELDAIGKHILDECDVQEKLRSVFGNDVVNAGEIDTQLLAKRAFFDAQSIETLNDITHEAIALNVEHNIIEMDKSDNCDIVLIETPFPVKFLLATKFKSVFKDSCTIAIVAPYENRMTRCEGRIDNAEIRDKRQREYGPYTGDIVIANDGSTEDFLRTSEKVLERVMEECL